MRYPVSDCLREVSSFLDSPEGDVTTKLLDTPDIKPPRREDAVNNKSNRTDYMKIFMRKYREDGKDYQKMPKMIKELRKKHRKKHKKHENS